MKLLIVLLILVLVCYIAHSVIKINSLFLMISKDDELIKKENELEKDYQFIKGLY